MKKRREKTRNGRNKKIGERRKTRNGRNEKRREKEN